MTKIMLVEDDKSLREIYGVRLLAEGYDIVSAGDGEEALAMAIKERPQLIVSDVMMPKISGFDMLDILRSTTETRNIKVIMMTALSSEEQRQRGEQLGADRYLVKSQVGIEDVVRVVHEVLGDAPAAAPATPAPQAAQPAEQPRAAAPAAPSPRVAAPAQNDNRPQLAGPRQVESTSANPVAPSVKSRIIQPLNDPMVATIDINDLLDKELAKEAGVDVNARPAVATVDAEKELVATQLDQFQEQLPTESADSEPAPEADDLPSVTISPDGQFTSEHTDDDETPQPTTPATTPVAEPQPTQTQVTPPAPQQSPVASTMPTPISFTNTAAPAPAPAPQPVQPTPVSAPAPVSQPAPALPPQPTVAAVPSPPPPPSVPPLPQTPTQPQATPVAAPASDQTQDTPVQPTNQ